MMRRRVAMLKSLAALLAAAAVLSGCGYTYPVILDRAAARGDTLTVVQVNELLAERGAVMRLRDSRNLDAFEVLCSADSCSFTPSGSSLRRSLPSRQIRSIEYQDHVSGAVGGFIGGAIIGGGLGFLLGSVESRETSPAIGGVRGLLVGGASSGTLGLILGGLGGAAYELQVISDTTGAGARPAVK